MAEVVCVALATAKGFGSVAVRRDLRAACTEEAAAELISDIVQLDGPNSTHHSNRSALKALRV